VNIVEWLIWHNERLRMVGIITARLEEEVGKANLNCLDYDKFKLVEGNSWEFRKMDTCPTSFPNKCATCIFILRGGTSFAAQ
jgi:hypothetical protein